MHILKFGRQVAIFLSDANIVQKWRSEEMIESQQWIPEADSSRLKNHRMRQILLSGLFLFYPGLKTSGLIGIFWFSVYPGFKTSGYWYIFEISY